MPPDSQNGKDCEPDWPARMDRMVETLLRAAERYRQKYPERAEERIAKARQRRERAEEARRREAAA